jgi:hypothetical protein
MERIVRGIEDECLPRWGVLVSGNARGKHHEYEVATLAPSKVIAQPHAQPNRFDTSLFGTDDADAGV